jgi:hypothetical protein
MNRYRFRVEIDKMTTATTAPNTAARMVQLLQLNLSSRNRSWFAVVAWFRPSTKHHLTPNGEGSM